jgi:hypothetical protein
MLPECAICRVSGFCRSANAGLARNEADVPDLTRCRRTFFEQWAFRRVRLSCGTAICFRLGQRGAFDVSTQIFRRTIVRYSVVRPEGDSSGWQLVDERGEIVFSGHQQDCEEWLDLADMRRSMSESSEGGGTEPDAIHLPIADHCIARRHARKPARRSMLQSIIQGVVRTFTVIRPSPLGRSRDAADDPVTPPMTP